MSNFNLKVKDVLLSLTNIGICFSIQFIPCWIYLNGGCYSPIYQLNDGYHLISILSIITTNLSVLFSIVQIADAMVRKVTFIRSAIYSGVLIAHNLFQCLLITFAMEIDKVQIHRYNFPGIAIIVWTSLQVLIFMITFCFFLVGLRRRNYSIVQLE